MPPSRRSLPSRIPSISAGSNSSVPTSLAPSSPPPPPIFTEELQDLRNRIDFLAQVAESLGTDPQMVLNIKSSVVDGITFLEKVLKEGQVADASSLDSYPLPQNEPPVQFSTGLSSSVYEAETMEMRYLYVSNGHEIFLLDLKKTNENPLSNAGDAPPLPIIATVNLIEKRHPVLVSLFKLGSDAYIIGGRKYNAELTLHGWFDMGGCKGTTRDSFRLSFADGKDTLSLAKGVIGKMKCPKISPIVEEIDGEIHVFDSTLRGSCPSSDWRFSHEVLHKFVSYDDQHGCCRCSWKWRKIRTCESPVDYFIQSHLVVGPRIYAISGYKALLFDSGKEEKKWEVLESNPECPYNIRSLQTVCDILRHGGVARCVLVLGSDEKEVENRMYVIIALAEKDEGCFHDETTYAVAYLVNSSGNIVCRQPLDHFFEGGPMQPTGMKAGMVIRADVEGKIMCSLVNACAEATGRDHLFVNTFTVEKLTSFDSSKFEMARRPVFAEFICVDIKERFIYKTEGRLYNSLQACVM